MILCKYISVQRQLAPVTASSRLTPLRGRAVRTNVHLSTGRGATLFRPLSLSGKYNVEPCNHATSLSGGRSGEGKANGEEHPAILNRSATKIANATISQRYEARLGLGKLSVVDRVGYCDSGSTLGQNLHSASWSRAHYALLLFTTLGSITNNKGTV
jgi:hypothetical protein